MMVIRFKTKVLILFIVLTNAFTAQVVTGSITYERRTNLYKKVGERAKEWIKEKDKIKKEFFTLDFTPSESIFQVVESDVVDRMSWATSRNLVYRDLTQSSYYSIRDIWGDLVHVEDTLQNIIWKITSSSRKIAGYNCRKAFWEVNDSLTIYAWYSDAIVPSIGPEKFHGLPGAILGLAKEDGSIVYFATEVRTSAPEDKVFEFKRSKKTSSLEAIREKIEIVMSKNTWWKSDISYFFIW